MHNPEKTVDAIVSINLRLFMAVVFAITSALIWPTDPEWWGFIFPAVGLGLGAFGVGIKAFKSMLKIYQLDKAIFIYLTQGNQPKTSSMVSDKGLKNEGMTNE